MWLLHVPNSCGFSWPTIHLSTIGTYRIIYIYIWYPPLRSTLHGVSNAFQTQCNDPMYICLPQCNQTSACLNATKHLLGSTQPKQCPGIEFHVLYLDKFRLGISDLRLENLKSEIPSLNLSKYRASFVSKLPCVYDRSNLLERASTLSSTVCLDTMAIPVSGSVTLNGSQAVVVLDVGAQNAPTTPGAPLQILLQKMMDGQMPIHESRLPVLKKHLAAMVCNVQRGLKLAPAGLLGAWSKEAESRLLTLLKKPKMVRPPAA